MSAALTATAVEAAFRPLAGIILDPSDVQRLATRLVDACYDSVDRYDRGAALVQAGWAAGYRAGAGLGHVESVRFITTTVLTRAASARVNTSPADIDAARYLHAATISPAELAAFPRVTKVRAPASLPSDPAVPGYPDVVVDVVAALAAELGQGVAVTLDQIRPMPGRAALPTGGARLLAATHQAARALAFAHPTVVDPGPGRGVQARGEDGVDAKATHVAAAATAGLLAGHRDGSADAASSAVRRVITTVADQLGDSWLRRTPIDGRSAHTWLLRLDRGARDAVRRTSRQALPRSSPAQSVRPSNPTSVPAANGFPALTVVATLTAGPQRPAVNGAGGQQPARPQQGPRR